MHDIWNPWHGCVKVSEAAPIVTCIISTKYAARQMARRSIARRICATRWRRIGNGNYKIRPGEMLRVCMTSRFLSRRSGRLAR